MFAATLCFLTDLTRVKSVRACLPPAGALPRPPRQARPDLRTSGRWQAPCRRACALRQRPGGASTGSPADRAGRFDARGGAAAGLRQRQTTGRAQSRPPEDAVGCGLICRHAARRRCVRAGALRPGDPARQGWGLMGQEGGGVHPALRFAGPKASFLRVMPGRENRWGCRSHGALNNSPRLAETLRTACSLQAPIQTS